MCRALIVLLMVSVCSFVLSFDQKCTSEVQGFHQCIKDFHESQKAAHSGDKEKREADVKSCFTKSGCKEPSFDKQQDGGDSSKQQCHKQLHEKVVSLIKDCVSSKTDLDWPFSKDQHEEEHRGGPGGHGGHGDHDGPHDQIKTLCPSDKQQNDTKSCLRGLFQQNKGSKDSKMQEAEARFNKMCDAKRNCFSKISQVCETKFNKTKEAVCECTKAKVQEKAQELDQQAQSCSAKSPQGNKSGEKESFSSRVQKRSCDNHEDKCSKPFQPDHDHDFQGRGGQGGHGHHSGGRN